MPEAVGWGGEALWAGALLHLAVPASAAVNGLHRPRLRMFDISPARVLGLTPARTPQYLSEEVGTNRLVPPILQQELVAEKRTSFDKRNFNRRLLKSVDRAAGEGHFEGSAPHAIDKVQISHRRESLLIRVNVRSQI